MPALKIWRAQPDLTVVADEIEVSSYSEMTVGSWTLAVPHQVLREIREQRQARLPNETGGVLIGVFDTQHRRVYIVDLIPSPTDSQESPISYTRGVEGVPEELCPYQRMHGPAGSVRGRMALTPERLQRAT